MPPSPAILRCDCAGSDRFGAALPEALASTSLPIHATADLCGLAAAGAPRLRELAAAGPLLILACAPRAVRALLRAAGVDAATAARVEVADRVALAAEELAAAVDRFLAAAGTPPTAPPGARSELPAPDPAGWTPWFPVLDAERCTGCNQCAEFCLFGVYEAGADGAPPRVAAPRRCKTGCPACARLCPAGAVLFPKHESPSIRGAAAPAAGAEADLLATLHRRSRERRLLRDPDDGRRRAEEERRDCAGTGRRPSGGEA
jgi:NAD-dependent dihydropyrimidine dehydrogenase PreA subunit